MRKNPKFTLCLLDDDSYRVLANPKNVTNQSF